MFKNAWTKLNFFVLMFDDEIKRDYFYYSFDLALAQDLQIYKFFQIIVIDQNFNGMKIVFQILFSMFKTHHTC